jgi:zinc and cadmium transporter
MNTAVLLTFASTGAVSLLALLGFLTFKWIDSSLRSRLSVMIAAAVGVLIGEAVCHLIPEALRNTGKPWWVAEFVALGALGSLGLEIAIRRFRSRSTIAPVGVISLISETVHNAIDGGILAGAFLAGPHIGFVTTIAVVFHEIPHELGNFAVLVHAGYDRKKAVLLNFGSACAAFMGAGTMLALGSQVSNATNWILPCAAGSFLYIALADLLPDLLRDRDFQHRAVDCFAATAGIAFMVLLARAS